MLGGYGFREMASEKFFSRVALGTPRVSVLKFSSSKNKNRREKLADFYVPNNIQPGENSKGGDKDGFSHENVRVARCERELERRWLERECQLGRGSERVERGQPGVFSPLLFSPVYLAGVLLRSPFRHPPNMRPISSSFCDKTMNLSWGISLFSQAI